MSYLRRRKGGYYAVRVRVPKDIAEEWKRAHGRRSDAEEAALGTNELEDAKRKVRPKVAEIFEQFDRFREAMNGGGGEPAYLTSDEIEVELQARMAGLLESVREYQEKDQPLVSGGEHDNSPEGQAAALRELAIEFHQAYISNDLSYADNEAARIIDGGGYKVPEDSASYRELCRGLLSALRDGYMIAAERVLGHDAAPEFPLNPKLRDTVTLRPLDRYAARPRASRGAGDKFSAVAEQYVSAMMRAGYEEWTNQTKGQNETTYRLFAEYARDAPFAEVRNSDVASFKREVLERIRRDYGKSKASKDRSLMEILADSDGKPGLAPKTIRRHMSALTALFKWAKSEGRYAGENPASGHRVTRAKLVSRPRDAFTDEELGKLFRSPVWTGSHRFFRSRPGPKIVKDARYWLPLVALFSGSRLEEMAALLTEDVCEHEGVWCLRLREYENRRLKTESAERLVPLHSELVKLGFVDHAEKARAKNGHLFPELKPYGPDDRLGGYVTKQFGAYLKQIKLKRPGLDFHSFRATFITALENAEVPEHRAAKLVGHKYGKMTFGQYLKRNGIGALQEAVEKVRYGGLDLSRLYPKDDRAA